MNALIRVGALAVVIALAQTVVASEAPCETCLQQTPPQQTCEVEEAAPSWIFRRSTYTHDPETGARVAQYMRIRPVEPLEDERNVTSRYSRSRTNLRGTDGSVDNTYTVQSWGNGRGGLDAEWERFHDAWKESYLQGGYYNGPVYGGGYGPWNGNGYGPNYGNGYGPGYGNGYSGYSYPGGGWNGPGNWGPQGPGPNGGGPGPYGNGGPGGGPNGNHNGGGNGP